MSLFADSPAAQAGLQVHDILLKVDGGSVRDESGKSRTLGPEGSNVRLTLQRPGKPPYDLILTRRQVTGQLPIDYCLVPRTRVGYIFLPTLLDKTMEAQVSEALRKMTAEGPLQGLILDNRMNGGGLGSQAKAIMSLFAGGVPGYFVSRTSRESLQLNPEDYWGLAETAAGGLGRHHYRLLWRDHERRAAALGPRPDRGRTNPKPRGTTAPLQVSRRLRAWLASDTFEPQGMTKNIWEYTGIVPDVPLPTRWDLFTEANDPGLAKGVELLMKK
jgi:carboxyl-terminal processing protease